MSLLKVVAFSGVLLFGCGGRPTPAQPSTGRIAEAPPPPPATHPCSGTPLEIFNRCGCHPVDDRLITALDATELTDLARTSVRKCLSGEATADVQVTDFSAKFVGCVSRETKLDPDLKAALARIAESAAGSVTAQEKEQYGTCRYSTPPGTAS